MAVASTSTLGMDTTSETKSSCLGGIENLRLKVGPVRRNLFGPVDHGQLQRDFQRLLCMSVEVANKRWNFDFQNDVPRKGSDVEWEELRCQDVPAFYRSVVRPVARAKAKRRGSTSSSSSSDVEGSNTSSSSSGSGEEYLEVTTRGCYRLKRLGKHKQSAITDFFMVKKKRKLLHCKAPSRQ